MKAKFINYDILVNYIFIIVGVYIVSLGTNMFLLPYKLTTGGASGVATILYYIFNIPMGISIIFINLPLFLFAIYKFGLKFSIRTVISTILLCIFLEITKYNYILDMTTSDLFISCVFGGLVTGFGLSLVLKGGASTGGSDLLAQIINEYVGAEKLSDILIVIEIVIISCIMIVFKDINLGLYCFIALFISTKVIDIVFTGVNYVKVVNIITRKSEKIIPYILNDLKRGATVTNSIGAHSGEKVTTITCIVTRPQISKIKRIIKKNDVNAIMYITTVNDAIGNGFREISQ